jgi:hypothetical protein
MVDWCYLGHLRFTHPFFNQTIETALQRPFSLLFRHQTTLDFLEEVNVARPGLSPSGFAFHMSRCGSTLVAQMLAALRWAVVISEGSPIDFALSAGRGPVAAEQCVRWLRRIIGVLGRPRAENETHYFLKFDSWHILQLPLIRQAFPDVPWIFLYRDPFEVLASHRNQTGAQMLPGAVLPPLLPLDGEELAQMPLDEYGARVLARFCQAGLTYARALGGTLLNYSQLPEAVESTLLPLWHVDCGEPDLRLLRQASQRDAKNPALRFEGPRSLPSSSERLKALADQWLRPIYNELEAERLRQSASAGTSLPVFEPKG